MIYEFLVSYFTQDIHMFYPCQWVNEASKKCFHNNLYFTFLSTGAVFPKLLTWRCLSVYIEMGGVLQ